MIFAIREGVREYFLAHGYPVEVDCGPDWPIARGVTRQSHRIAIDHDRESGDEIVAPVGTQRNPKRIFARMVGYVATIFARDPAPNAFVWEHDVELNKIVDGLLVALQDWSKSQCTMLRVTSGRLLTFDELQGLELATTAAGYELRFQIARSVDRRDYDGSALPTADLSDVDTDTRVSLDGDTFEEIS